jgi:hypothetical protein
LPFLRASESPMAIACLRLLTVPPLPPLPLSVPFLRLLRAGRKRPCRGRAKPRDEPPPSHPSPLQLPCAAYRGWGCMSGLRGRSPDLFCGVGKVAAIKIAGLSARSDGSSTTKLTDWWLGRKGVTDATASALDHPCLAIRSTGISGGNEIQGWRDSSQNAIVGAGRGRRGCLW